MEIVKIRNLYKFLFREITNITIKRYLCSLDGEDDDDERYFETWIMNRPYKFREFPIIPDRGEVWWYRYNIYNWFKSEFRQYDDRITVEML